MIKGTPSSKSEKFEFALFQHLGDKVGIALHWSGNLSGEESSKQGEEHERSHWLVAAIDIEKIMNEFKREERNSQRQNHMHSPMRVVTRGQSGQGAGRSHGKVCVFEDCKRGQISGDAQTEKQLASSPYVCT